METASKLTYRFKVGDRIFFEEEVLTVQKLTSVGVHPCYYVNELPYPVADKDCREVPVYFCQFQFNDVK